MPYIPPQLRKPKTENELMTESMTIVQEKSDKHFPILCSNLPVVSQSSLSYSEKMKEWDEKRKQSEINEYVEKEMAKYHEKAMREEEYERSSLPVFASKPKKVEEPRVEPLPEVPKEDEWIKVEKRYKPRKNVIKQEETAIEDDFDHLVRDEEGSNVRF
jgi:hypothetical protein